MPQTTNEVDPRIAATGGRRRVAGDPKSGYEWPGMMAAPDWVKTRVHRHTRVYGCTRCGVAFHTPHAVYAHLARAHPALGSRPRSGRLGPSEGRAGGNGRVGAGVPQIAVRDARPQRNAQLRLVEVS